MKLLTSNKSKSNVGKYFEDIFLDLDVFPKEINTCYYINGSTDENNKTYIFLYAGDEKFKLILSIDENNVEDYSPILPLSFFKKGLKINACECKIDKKK